MKRLGPESVGVGESSWWWWVGPGQLYVEFLGQGEQAKPPQSLESGRWASRRNTPKPGSVVQVESLLGNLSLHERKPVCPKKRKRSAGCVVSLARSQDALSVERGRCGVAVGYVQGRKGPVEYSRVYY